MCLFTVKLENFQSEMDYALSLMDGDTTQLEQGLLNQKEHLNPTKPYNYLKYYQQLNTSQISQLKEMYQDDFDIFEYPADFTMT